MAKDYFFLTKGLLSISSMVRISKVTCPSSNALAPLDCCWIHNFFFIDSLAELPKFEFCKHTNCFGNITPNLLNSMKVLLTSSKQICSQRKIDPGLIHIFNAIMLYNPSFLPGK